MKSKRLSVLIGSVSLLLILGVASLVAACAPVEKTTTETEAAPTAKEPIKLGLVSDFTGAAHLSAEHQRIGAQIAIDEVNEAGGVLGRELQLLTGDSALKTDKGVAAARELILNKHVDFMTGPISSGVRLAISDVCRRNEVPLIDSVGGSKKLNGKRGHEYFWQLSVPTTAESYSQAFAISRWEDAKTLITIGPDYVWGHEEVEGNLNALKELRPDIEVLESYWPKLGAKDYTTYISAIMSKDPDVLSSPFYGGDELNFIKQAKPYGLFDEMRVLMLDDVGNFGSLGKESPRIWGFSRCPSTLDTPQMKDFVARFKSRMNGQLPGYTAIFAYEWVKVIKYGAEKAGSVDGSAWVQAMKGASVPGLLRGTITFRECDNLSNSKMYIGPEIYQDEYGQAVVMPPEPVDCSPVRRTCEEIKELRGQME